jgi:hypothetical protein
VTSVALLLLLLLAGYIAYAIWYFGWEARNTAGMAYYGRSLEHRRALKRRLLRLSRPVVPLLQFLAAIGRKNLTMPLFDYEGVAGPKRVSTPEVFARARRYEPQPEDVFVATQMRCGTTWMQELVHQIVTRGKGEFTRPDRSHLYALSPWIEAVNSVSIEDAPLIGTRSTRIIKTHLPASHCPFSTVAKYIYVARHPVSCFASIVDFNRSMLGPLLPPLETMAAWYCSDRMYWRPWPEHVEGWWRLAQANDNVLFVHFEDMTRDLGQVCDRIARHLGCVLDEHERAQVLEKCSFKYMKEHEEFFEMAPPTMFSVTGGQFMASGREKRHEDVTPAIKARIASYCREALKTGSYPARQFYPDLVD